MYIPNIYLWTIFVSSIIIPNAPMAAYDTITFCRREAVEVGENMSLANHIGKEEDYKVYWTWIQAVSEEPKKSDYGDTE